MDSDKFAVNFYPAMCELDKAIAANLLSRPGDHDTIALELYKLNVYGKLAFSTSHSKRRNILQIEVRSSNHIKTRPETPTCLAHWSSCCHAPTLAGALSYDTIIARRSSTPPPPS